MKTVRSYNRLRAMQEATPAVIWMHYLVTPTDN